MILATADETTQGWRHIGKHNCEISAVIDHILAFPKETVPKLFAFFYPSHRFMLRYQDWWAFHLGIKSENNTFPPCCTLFPLPRFDTCRCTQHTVLFPFMLLVCAHFTQNTFLTNITKCLKNRTEKTNILLWQHSVKYQREHRWLWLPFPTPLVLLSKYHSLEAFVCVKFYSVILITQLCRSLQFSFHGSVPLLGL